MRYARIFPQKINTGDNINFYDSTTEVWVHGILKKQLLELGVTILKTQNHYGTWHFLLSVSDGEIVREAYPSPYEKQVIS